MTKKISPVLMTRHITEKGTPLVGASVSVFIQGSATVLASIYADAAGTPLANPQITNSAGFVLPIFLANETSYNLVLRDKSDVVVQSFQDILI